MAGHCAGTDERDGQVLVGRRVPPSRTCPGETIGLIFDGVHFKPRYGALRAPLLRAPSAGAACEPRAPISVIPDLPRMASLWPSSGGRTCGALAMLWSQRSESVLAR